MAKSSAKKKSASGTKQASAKVDPQKVKALGNELRAQLSVVADALKAKRKKPGITTADKTIIDLRLKLVEDLQEDVLHVCWGRAPFCCGSATHHFL
jgi:hypothetical protein